MIVYIQRSRVPSHKALHEVMAERGLRLRYFRFFFFPIRRGIVFIHFPDSCISASSRLKVIVKSSFFLISILLAKISGSRIIWEVNNMRSHERRFALFEAILMAVFTRSVAGVIHNSNSSVREAFETYPALKRARWTVIPESNFRFMYPERGETARGRQILDVEEGQTVILAFGLIRRYKGADRLIEVFKQIQGPALRLVIAGIPIDRTYADQVQHAARSDGRIRTIFRDIPHDEVPHIYAATTLACAPFRATLNSGSVVLALSCACPVLAPRVGTLPDLEEQVGTDWIMLYGGELDPQILQMAITWAGSPRPHPPELGFCDFERVATDTIAFVTEIGSVRSGIGNLSA